ncbi:MAG: bacteriophage abortive infection AbiH family protein [Bacteroidetes bacterium]|nr:bacteriophage abortive infection AbiH family protein [Bacteroidota bacterium]
MNRLVVIGNGFDLAHGLPTSYKDLSMIIGKM